MGKLENIAPERVFKYFEEISAIARGSGNMEAISAYCMDFAKAHSLEAVCDAANNVVIFKNASAGYENSAPIILQGHLDMVCQKTEESSIDFEKDGLDLYVEGDLLKARGTTLGADNGIAVSMILAILESDNIEHPPIEAVFTSDEEIGMIGAMQLDTSILKSRRMINLDSEDRDELTVSCAGGSELCMSIPVVRRKTVAQQVEIVLKGLKGGHSGVEINSGRVNAAILAGRVLNFAKNICDIEIISIDSGDKSNAIPLYSSIKLAVQNANEFADKINAYLEVIKEEILEREEGFAPIVKIIGEGECEVFDAAVRDKVMFVLIGAPNGVMEMSASIDGLVETSLNLGILKTDDNKIVMSFALRSNKQSALCFLEEKLVAFASYAGIAVDTFGHYPPWEFCKNSVLQKTYKEAYKEMFGTDVKVCAIHAGLECGTFAAKIPDFDCISVGPQMWDVHTVNERLSISSTGEMFELLKKVLKNCK